MKRSNPEAVSWRGSMKIIALDIGGTTIKSCVFQDGELTGKQEIPSDAFLGGVHVVKLACEIVAGHENFAAVAIATAGQVDSEAGTISYANENIPGYTGTCLRKIFMDAFNVPVIAENDVYAAAIGEALYGAGKGKGDFLCLTYGTGIGGAIVRDGIVHKGMSNTAGEFGRIITHAEKHGDRLSGYYEANASVTALVSKVRAVRPELTDGKAILANLADAIVKAFVDDWINEVVYGLASLIHSFNPGLIVLGGGIMGSPFVIDSVRKKIKGFRMPADARVCSPARPDPFSDVTIVAAKLKNDAGLWGMYHIARGVTGLI